MNVIISVQPPELFSSLRQREAVGGCLQPGIPEFRPAHSVLTAALSFSWQMLYQTSRPLKPPK